MNASRYEAELKRLDAQAERLRLEIDTARRQSETAVLTNSEIAFRIAQTTIRTRERQLRNVHSNIQAVQQMQCAIEEKESQDSLLRLQAHTNSLLQRNIVPTRAVSKTLEAALEAVDARAENQSVIDELASAAQDPATELHATSLEDAWAEQRMLAMHSPPTTQPAPRPDAPALPIISPRAGPTSTIKASWAAAMKHL